MINCFILIILLYKSIRLIIKKAESLDSTFVRLFQNFNPKWVGVSQRYPHVVKSYDSLTIVFLTTVWGR